MVGCLVGGVFLEGWDGSGQLLLSTQVAFSGFYTNLFRI